MKTILSLALLVALTAVRSAAGADAKVGPLDLKQIGIAYAIYQNDGKAPENLADLEPGLKQNKKLIEHLQSQRIEFNYGVTIAEMTDGASNTILAYEKDAPIKGGYVLFGDISVRKITAEEFKKAPQAKKK